MCVWGGGGGSASMNALAKCVFKQYVQPTHVNRREREVGFFSQTTCMLLVDLNIMFC